MLGHTDEYQHTMLTLTTCMSHPPTHRPQTPTHPPPHSGGTHLTQRYALAPPKGQSSVLLYNPNAVALQWPYAPLHPCTRIPKVPSSCSCAKAYRGAYSFLLHICTM